MGIAIFGRQIRLRSAWKSAKPKPPLCNSCIGGSSRKDSVPMPFNGVSWNNAFLPARHILKEGHRARWSISCGVPFIKEKRGTIGSRKPTRTALMGHEGLRIGGQGMGEDAFCAQLRNGFPSAFLPWWSLRYGKWPSDSWHIIENGQLGTILSIATCYVAYWS